MNSELGRRVAFTLGALLVFRIGTYIPLPGIDLNAWEQVFRAHGGGALELFDVYAGGAVGRLAIFALGITPYVTAAIIVQFLTVVSPKLRALRSLGDQGRRIVEQYTRALTLVMTVFQAYALAIGLEAVSGLVADPGWSFRVSTILTLTGGVVFLMWLSGEITRRGIGNGIALILCAGIVTELPHAIAGMLELGRQGVLSTKLILGLAMLSVALIGFVTFMEKARRLVPLQFSQREANGRVLGGRSAYLAIKLNSAGIVPALIASWLLTALVSVLIYAGPQDSGWYATQRSFSHGQPAFMICYAAVVLLCVFLYAAFVLDPAEAAENLRRYGGTIPRVEPGEATAEHLDRVFSGTTGIGAIYLVTVCLIPELLIRWAEVPFYLGATALLILVCTVLDVEQQARDFAIIR